MLIRHLVFSVLVFFSSRAGARRSRDTYGRKVGQSVSVALLFGEDLPRRTRSELFTSCSSNLRGEKYLDSLLPLLGA